MSAITTHVLDISRGQPAAGIEVELARQDDAGKWMHLRSGTTNDDGRLTDLLAPEQALAAATYRLRFQVGPYLERDGGTVFYPFADVVFTIADVDQHYHVPLLLSRFGYSTYRGS